MTIHLQEQPKVSWFVELTPLGDKGAKVLANALHRALLPVAAIVGAEFAAASPATRPWFVHILVGDAVSTNEAAAKIVLAWVRAQPLAHNLRYFVMLVKCGNHQVNLAMASAVSGRAALAGAENSLPLAANPFGLRPQANRAEAAHRSVCGAIVRFAKYLVSDYYTDFCANLQDSVVLVFVVLWWLCWFCLDFVFCCLLRLG